MVIPEQTPARDDRDPMPEPLEYQAPVVYVAGSVREQTRQQNDGNRLDGNAWYP
jgi:hypothetical protein